MQRIPGISKTRRPKMSMHRGRTWDCWNLIFPDGSKGEAWLDTTWGEYFYFRTVEVEESGHEYHQWHSGKLYEFHDGQDCLIDLRRRLK